MENPSVAVVIPAFNCSKTIAQTLGALRRQTYRGPIEIIVVDDGSTDQTSQIVKSFEEVLYVRQDNAGPATTRNTGFKSSTSEIIFFTDSDCIPHEDWIERSVASFTDKKIAAVSGSYDIANPQDPLAMSIYREILFRHTKLMPAFPKAFGSYNVAIRRNILESLGGFNTGYRYPSGEDNDLSYKILLLGSKIFFNKESLVKHYFPTHIFQYLREQFRHGFWRVKVYFNYPKMAIGDDYTFWKDIVEPPLVILIFLFLCFSLAGWNLGPSLHASCLFGLIFLEVSYGFMIMRQFTKGVFFAMVMFLRAFARTTGFLVGFTFFLPSKVFRF
ncbi:MAG: glycosyltransferase family A protein [Candidatus Aceula meridiana]|nr:glycosyltransferase family A protein [Candidatus Aceula meridiana]